MASVEPFQFPLYTGISDAFRYPGPRNMSSLVSHIKDVQTAFPVRFVATCIVYQALNYPVYHDRTPACSETLSRITI
jgi:hypothetical protein